MSACSRSVLITHIHSINYDANIADMSSWEPFPLREIVCLTISDCSSKCISAFYVSKQTYDSLRNLSHTFEDPSLSYQQRFQNHDTKTGLLLLFLLLFSLIRTNRTFHSYKVYYISKRIVLCKSSRGRFLILFHEWPTRSSFDSYVALTSTRGLTNAIWSFASNTT